MSYNKQYNTRQSSGRYNTPGQFVSAGEQNVQQQQYTAQQQRAKPAPPPPPPQPPAYPPQQQYPAQQQYQPQQQQQQQPEQPQEQVLQDADVEMKQEADGSNGVSGPSFRPAWMKWKFGLKKITKRERRRRQNAHLRRLLVPKNALMVLNEMLLHDQLANASYHLKVEPVEQGGGQYYKTQSRHSFCAELTLDGKTYKGYGESKMVARNAAAEQGIRDLILKRLSKVVAAETEAEASGASVTGGASGAGAASTTGAAGGAEGEEGSEGGAEEESLPMIQIASFALHKLFAEWEGAGHRVPHLRPPPGAPTSESEAETGLAPPPPPAGAPPKKPKELPANARAMHPCMLLTYMRPHQEYRELAVEGDRPQNMLFTMGVEVDGSTYVGKASNKKEARKAAARAACAALFGVRFDDQPTANAPATLAH